MNNIATDNLGFVECWNEILTPKWIRFRHLLSGNGKLHSDIAMGDFDIRAGDRVLDVGCGFGETALEIGSMVGDAGEVLGLDCTEAFVEVAEQERVAAGVHNVRYELGDAQEHPLRQGHYDVAFSRMGFMFFQSAVRALRNTHSALRPGGKVCLIVWRSLRDNQAWCAARDIALKYLPAPGDSAATCGPGPFSMANEETDRAMLGAAGFRDVEVFRQIDVDIQLGRTLEEAVDYQLLVGPAGEIIREAGEEGLRCLPAIRAEVEEKFSKYLREDGVFMPSSTWAIVARKGSDS